MIRAAVVEDAAAVARIYNHYVLDTVVTFEEQAVSDEDMAGRIRETSVAFPWLVAEDAGQLVGYAYAGKWSGRCAYRTTVECTVYLDPAVIGRGVGTRLYSALFDILRSRSMHVAIGVIALPNVESIALHEKFGLVKVGHFKEVGFKFGRWVDVGYWQVVL